MAKAKPDHVAQNDWDAVESPPLSSEFIAGMRPASETVPRKIYEHLTRRSEPQEAPAREQVTLELDRDLIKHFKKQGKGWRLRVNDTLRQAVQRELTAKKSRRSGAA